MKALISFISLFWFSLSYADLYIQTDYQEKNGNKISTKHHIFLETPYKIDYTKKSYVLVLKKLNSKEAVIETESYDRAKNGRRTMHGGSYGAYKIGSDFSLVDHAANGAKRFRLKIFLEKAVPVKP